MDIQSAQYITDENGNTDTIVKIVHSNGTVSTCPTNPDNRHYAAILEWVAEGNTIQEAE
jgi:hypothetical protein